MKIIGITGGVGAGKSTVLDYLSQKHHAYVIQADKVGHLVMEPEGLCYEQVIALFGRQVIKDDKTIDRRQVSDVVFGNELMRQSLDDIIHPAVKTYILDEIRHQKETGCDLLIVEAALLLEEHYEEFCDAVWYIHTDAEVRIQRLMDSRGYTRAKAKSIIARQASEEFFKEHADYMIINNGDLQTTWNQIEEGIKLL
ncbi:dephospho-CoA kinase [Blautia sp. MSJ-19]|uniref:dephospho-CoA kinase n=1 Tax=Blautia sp. MSJ-19 TaxID=2841517 RepID=UPI001C0ECDA0|nr:dephospho-CoA kinase [Blautia sp. MSJ-19]MBU5481750.1 dephospho-CoA kinase [Blautia sp. MSJ-19]